MSVSILTLMPLLPISGMKLSTQCVCLVLFLAVSAVASRTVTNDEKAKINKGITAAKDLTNVIQTAKNVSDVLKKMTDTIGPWVDGIGIFTEVLGFFLPGENDLLNEMKKGFEEVNKRLDAIKDGLSEVKEAIDWAVVKVNFQGIEQDIRLLDTKLDEVLQAPDPEDGKEEYIRVYENQYNEAGLLLWDSIVNDDQVFYENIVTAGMKYTDYHRGKMDKFMRGLIALILKSSNIEVSYEKFKEQNRGMSAIWKKRLGETKDALTKADQVLENAWKDLFRGEVDKISKDCKNWGHVDFRDKVYNFLTEKYPWRYWWVLVYDDVAGFNNHAYEYVGATGHHQLRHYGRNFMVGCTDPKASFDYQRAQSEIKDRKCPNLLRHCMDNSARHVRDLTPFIGTARIVVNASKGWAVICKKNHGVWGTMKLRLSTWGREHRIFFLG